MEETVLVVPDAKGNFTLTNHFAKPISALAIWIAADGDNSKSSFSVLLEKVELSLDGGASR
jgi:hypothetical protein